MVSLSRDFVVLLFSSGFLRKLAIIIGYYLLGFVVFDNILDDAVGGGRELDVALVVVFPVHHLLCRKGWVKYVKVIKPVLHVRFRVHLPETDICTDVQGVCISGQSELRAVIPCHEFDEWLADAIVGLDCTAILAWTVSHVHSLVPLYLFSVVISNPIVIRASRQVEYLVSRCGAQRYVHLSSPSRSVT